MHWNLPGPSKFIEEVVSHVNEGRSVFVLLPEQPLPLLQTAVHNQLGSVHWRSLEVPADNTISPAVFLFQCFVPPEDNVTLRTAAELVKHESFQGWAIWLTGVTEENFGPWTEFMLEYAHASRSLTTGVQTSLIVVCRGFVASLPSPKEAGIATLSWNGRLDRLDISLYAALNVPLKRSILERELAVATVAEIAAWDLVLVDHLAFLDLVFLLRPREVLIDYASQQWDNPSLPGAWWTGKSYEVKGGLRQHASFIARSSEEELKTLIWRAQVGVLMPYIEEQRRIYLDRYRHLLTSIALQYGNGPVRTYEVAELEVSHLFHQLQRMRSTAVEIVDLNHLSDLKDARNALAHLMPVELEILTRLCERDASSAR